MESGNTRKSKKLEAEMISRIKSRYSQKSLLLFSELNGIKYSGKITSKNPNKEKILNDLQSKKAQLLDDLNQILELNRYLRTGDINIKAKELSLIISTEDGRLDILIKIWCKNPNELKKLVDYRGIDPSRSMFSSNQVQLSLDKFMEKQDVLKKLINENLSEGKESIVTLDKISNCGKKIRFEIHYDKKQRVKERKASPEFPGRAGPYRDIFPERKMYVEFNEDDGKFKVSATNKAQNVLKVISKAIFGKDDAISIQKPTSVSFYDNIKTKESKKMMKEKDIKVTEVELLNLPLEGSPSYMKLKGNNLLETFDQLATNKVPVLGKGLSEIKTMTIFIGKNRIQVDYGRGNQRRTGRISEEEGANIDKLLIDLGLLS